MHGDITKEKFSTTSQHIFNLFSHMISHPGKIYYHKKHKGSCGYLCCPTPQHRDNLRRLKSSEAAGLTFHRAGEGKTSERWKLMSEMLATATMNLLCSRMVVTNISSHLLQVSLFIFLIKVILFYSVVLIFRLVAFLS